MRCEECFLMQIYVRFPRTVRFKSLEIKILEQSFHSTFSVAQGKGCLALPIDFKVA